MEIYSSTWPQDYDFRIDKACQDVFRPFIENALNELKKYDEKRPVDRTYIFHEHALRVAKDVRKTCLFIGLDEHVAENMYWAVLPHDIGKMRLPVEIWDTAEKPSDTLKARRRTHTVLGAELIQDSFKDLVHPFKDLMIDIARHHHEQLDGQGTLGLSADQISLPVRLAAIVEAFDGWSIPRPHFGKRDISPAGVIKRMREEKLHMFDQDLFESFATMKLA